jgi:hypothetical protein
MCVCENDLRGRECLTDIVSERFAPLPNVAIRVRSKQGTKFCPPVSKKIHEHGTVIMVEVCGCE